MSLSDSVPLSSVKPSGPGRAYEGYSYVSQPKSSNASALSFSDHIGLAVLTLCTTARKPYGTACRSQMSRKSSLGLFQQTTRLSVYWVSELLPTTGCCRLRTYSTNVLYLGSDPAPNLVGIWLSSTLSTLPRPQKNGKVPTPISRDATHAADSA
jgi:hypothetical protein